MGIVTGDCVEVMATFEPESIDAIVTDPPYGLEFMGKEWDRLGWQGGGGFSKPGIGDRPTAWASFSATSRFGAANPTCATCGGRARGKRKCACAEPDWKPIGKRRNPENADLPSDMTGGGMARHMSAMQEWHERWAREAFRVAKPGAYLLAFGGTRTVHRLAVAVEDAGWEIRDMLMWGYATGFPKSLDVAKAIDKAERGHPQGSSDPDSPAHGKYRTQATEGIRGESDNGRGYGAGPGQFMREDVGSTARPLSDTAREWQGWGTALKPAFEPIVMARKPLRGTVAANVLEHGTGALNIDGCRIGTTVETWPVSRSYAPGQKQPGSKGETVATGPVPPGRWPANVILTDPILDDQSRFFLIPKASRRERGEGNDHPTVKPVALMRHLVRLVTPPGGVVLDPFLGSGTTAIAARDEGFDWVGIERDPDYAMIAAYRLRK